MSSRPILVGVTGGIGSGKSTVCKILEVLGHYVYYADDRAKWLMRNNEKVRGEIVALFGEEAYSGEVLNRKFIGELAFKNEGVLAQLNAVVHPAVGEDLTRWITANIEETLLFDEAALMFEVGSHKKMDATILVTAPEELRIKRVLQRDNHRSEESVREIIGKQMVDRDKIPLADYVIENDEKKSVIRQTLTIYHKLLNRYR